MDRANFNEYLIFDKHAEIIIISEKYGKFNIKIDLEDVDICKKHFWGIGAYRNKKDSEKIFHYAVNNKIGFLHRYVMGNPDGYQVDHKNQKTTDCRKENLRKATASQQMMNGGIRKDSVSGHRGITWNKATSKWIAYIEKNKKRTYLGYFDNISDAISVRKKAEEEYFGEFRKDNE